MNIDSMLTEKDKEFIAQLITETINTLNEKKSDKKKDEKKDKKKEDDKKSKSKKPKKKEESKPKKNDETPEEFTNKRKEGVEDDMETEREILVNKLDDPMVNKAEITRKLFHPKNKKDLSSYNSMVHKWINGYKDDNGYVWRIPEWAISKLNSYFSTKD